MTPKTFFTQLGIISGLLAIVLGFVNNIEVLSSHQSITWVCWSFFVLFSVGMFYICSKSAKSENKNLFGQLFLVSIFFKMLLCILILIVYLVAGKPTNMFFVIPFLSIYLVFTIYEVYFVTKLAKQN